MNAKPDLIERLCRALAFHTIESEVTLSHAEGELDEWAGECQTARALISEAGLDIDQLYPIKDRPTSEGAPIGDPTTVADGVAGEMLDWLDANSMRGALGSNDMLALLNIVLARYRA